MGRTKTPLGNKFLEKVFLGRLKDFGKRYKDVT